MPVEITPEPTPEERKALIAALADDPGPAQGSVWWEAGIREAVGEEDAPPGESPPGLSPAF